MVGGSVAGVFASFFDNDGTLVKRVTNGVFFGAAMGLGLTAMITTADGVMKLFSQFNAWFSTQKMIGWTFVNGRFVPIFGDK